MRVVHCKKHAYDVYIGRPSKWGNPFLIGRDGTRGEIIEKYRSWILTQPYLIGSLPELSGKILGCWCYPKNCHGEVLIDMVNKYKIGDGKITFCSNGDEYEITVNKKYHPCNLCIINFIEDKNNLKVYYDKNTDRYLLSVLDRDWCSCVKLIKKVKNLRLKGLICRI